MLLRIRRTSAAPSAAATPEAVVSGRLGRRRQLEVIGPLGEVVKRRLHEIAAAGDLQKRLVIAATGAAAVACRRVVSR